MAIAFSDEIYRKISPLVESQFPGFLREEAPTFVAFLKAYYEFAEKTGNPVNAIRGLPDFQDIDRTTDALVEYYRQEFLESIPKNVLADKRLLVKYIREFYRSRGSELSYRFLFRAMFGREIELIYPTDQILRASDGRWVKQTVIRVAEPFSANPTLFDGNNLTGETSGARGRVESIIQREILGIPVYEITLDHVVGNFIDAEIVTDGTNTAAIFTAAGTLTGIGIENGGAYNSNGDKMTFYSTTDSGTATVLSTTDRSALFLRILHGGDGFTLGNTVIRTLGGSGTGLDATPPPEMRALIVVLKSCPFCQIHN